MFIYSSSFNRKPFHAISQPMKHAASAISHFSPVWIPMWWLSGFEGLVETLFWAVKVWQIKHAVVLWLVMVPDQCWTACHLSPLVKALESGSSGINRAFVLVVSSLCSPAEAGYKSPGGSDREEGAFLALRREAQAHSSPSLLQRILSKHRRNSHCQRATNGAFEAEWMTLPLQKA